MADEHFDEESIFKVACKIGSAQDRTKYLHQTCGGDSALFGRVGDLLRVYELNSAFLESPVAAGHLLEPPAANHFDVVLSPSATPESQFTDGPLGGRLGDFELVREIGRGGMGVVYEARQISLNRRVALKVLPFAAVFDPRQLRRFETEARAAAGLHHGNIVPVHQFGSDRAVHFYAMQYIEGQDASELIGQLRKLAELDELDLPVTAAADFSLASGLASGQFEPPDQTRLLPARGAGPLPQHESGVPKQDSEVDTHPLAALTTKDSVRGIEVSEDDCRIRNPSRRGVGICPPARHPAPGHQTLQSDAGCRGETVDH